MSEQIKVGVFFGLGLLTIMLTIFFLGSNKSFFGSSLRISSYFDAAQGLTNGAVVSLAGVKVGNVESIDFDEVKNLVRVSYFVSSEFQKKIKNDSIVEIRTQGALGDKYLYITPGKGTETIADNSEIKSEYGNDFLSIISKRGSESEKIFDVISDLQILIKGIVRENKIPHLIQKLDKAADNLQDTTAQLKNVTANNRIEKSMNRLDSILEKVDNGQGTLGALINDRSVHNRLKSILGAGEKQQQIKSILKSSVE